jgi:hypothetical protein
MQASLFLTVDPAANRFVRCVIQDGSGEVTLSELEAGLRDLGVFAAIPQSEVSTRQHFNIYAFIANLTHTKVVNVTVVAFYFCTLRAMCSPFFD